MYWRTASHVKMQSYSILARSDVKNQYTFASRPTDISPKVDYHREKPNRNQFMLSRCVLVPTTSRCLHFRLFTVLNAFPVVATMVIMMMLMIDGDDGGDGDGDDDDDDDGGGGC